jgi:hypothetical protein
MSCFVALLHTFNIILRHSLAEWLFILLLYWYLFTKITVFFRASKIFLSVISLFIICTLVLVKCDMINDDNIRFV